MAYGKNKRLNRILTGGGLLVLAWLAGLLLWASFLFETDQRTISDAMRDWPKNAMPIEFVAFGWYTGCPPFGVLCLLAGHWGWSDPRERSE